MNMKTIKILGLLLVLVLVSSCEKHQWVDWQMENQLWLIENAKKEGVITTPTGLQYKCIDDKAPSNAPRPDAAKYVTITYSGTFINGYEFDAATDYQSLVSDFVPGFEEGLKKMHQWSTYEFYIPAELAYGKTGRGTEGNSNYIPPHSTLIFRVYLGRIN